MPSLQQQQQRERAPRRAPRPRARARPRRRTSRSSAGRTWARVRCSTGSSASTARSSRTSPARRATRSTRSSSATTRCDGPPPRRRARRRWWRRSRYNDANMSYRQRCKHVVPRRRSDLEVVRSRWSSSARCFAAGVVHPRGRRRGGAMVLVPRAAAFAAARVRPRRHRARVMMAVMSHRHGKAGDPRVRKTYVSLLPPRDTSLLPQIYRFVDTAGIRRRNKVARVLARTVLCVVGASRSASRRRLGWTSVSSARARFVVVRCRPRRGAA